jgi:hypothetical protein
MLGGELNLLLRITFWAHCERNHSLNLFFKFPYIIRLSSLLVRDEILTYVMGLRRGSRYSVVADFSPSMSIFRWKLLPKGRKWTLQNKHGPHWCIWRSSRRTEFTSSDNILSTLWKKPFIKFVFQISIQPTPPDRLPRSPGLISSSQL